METRRLKIEFSSWIFQKFPKNSRKWNKISRKKVSFYKPCRFWLVFSNSNFLGMFFSKRVFFVLVDHLSTLRQAQVLLCGLCSDLPLVFPDVNGFPEGGIVGDTVDGKKVPSNQLRWR